MDFHSSHGKELQKEQAGDITVQMRARLANYSLVRRSLARSASGVRSEIAVNHQILDLKDCRRRTQTYWFRRQPLCLLSAYRWYQLYSRETFCLRPKFRTTLQTHHSLSLGKLPCFKSSVNWELRSTSLHGSNTPQRRNTFNSQQVCLLHILHNDDVFTFGSESLARQF
jgi:hypothetical protein